MNDTERATEVIKEAFDAAMSSDTRSTWAYQIAQALADAGLLMPDLPEPAYEGSTTWYAPGENEWATDTYKGKVMLEVDVEEADNFGTSMVTKTWFMQRDEASALAMAILAAANHAEQGYGNE